MTNDIDEILSYFEYIHSQNRTISIVNTYMGVSFSISANIIKVLRREKKIVITTVKQQNLSALPKTKVTLYSDLLPFPVLSMIESVDLPRRNATLQSFEYLRAPNGNRSSVRILVDEQIPIQLAVTSGFQLSGHIFDLSVFGISMTVPHTVKELNQEIDIGETVRLSFKLPLPESDDMQNFNLPAEVSHLTSCADEDVCRIGLRTFPTTSDQTILRRYIFDRQTEMFQTFNR